MKKIFLFIILLPLASWAQYLGIQAVDISGFPEIRAQLSVVDQGGYSIPDLSVQDVLLSHNGVKQKVISLNRIEEELLKLSIVLSVDVSGSMSGTNLDLAKDAASKFIAMTPLDFSECAITSFDTDPYVNSDFTKSRGKLLKTVSDIYSRGGTSYDAGLIDPMGSAFDVAKSGRYHRVVIFLTDGLSSGREQEMIAIAKSLDITVYCITLNMPMPDVLKNLAKQTGGKSYEYVKTIQEARDIYTQILLDEQRMINTELVWMADKVCDTLIYMDLSIRNLTTSYTFSIPEKYSTRFIVDPPLLQFGVAAQNDSLHSAIKLTAQNGNFKIDKIEVLNSHLFAVESPPIPFTVKENDTVTITAHYTPQDSGAVYGVVYMNSDVCGTKEIFLRGGLSYVRSSSNMESALKIINPNGGEVFAGGSVTPVVWTGTGQESRLRIEYSDNEGVSWNVAGTGTRLSYTWQVPSIEGDRYMIRVSENNWVRMMHLSGAYHGWSADGLQVLTQNGGGLSKYGLDYEYYSLWDYNTGRLVRTFSGGNKTNVLNDSVIGTVYIDEYTDKIKVAPVIIRQFDSLEIPPYFKVYYPDRRYPTRENQLKAWFSDNLSKVIVVTTNPYAVEMLEPSNGRVLAHYSERLVGYNKDSTLFITASWDTLTFRRVSDGEIEHKIYEPTVGYRLASYDRTGNYVLASGNNHVLEKWNLTTRISEASVQAHSSRIEYIAQSVNQQFVVTSSQDKTLKFWTTDSLALVRTFPWRIIDFSTSGRYILVSDKSSSVQVIDAEIADTLYSLPSGKIYNAFFSKNEQEFIVLDRENQFRRYQITTGIETGTASPGFVKEYSIVNDSLVLFSGKDRKYFYAWNLQQNTLQTSFKHRDYSGFLLSPSNRLALSYTRRGSILLWNTTEKNKSDKLKSPKDESIKSISFSPAETKIILTTGKNNVYLLDIATNESYKLDGVLLEINDNNHKVVTIERSKTYVWDSNTGNLLYTIGSHKRGVLALNYASDSLNVVTVGRDRTIKTWKTDSLVPTMVLGDKGYITNYHLNKNEDLLVLENSSKVVQVWDVKQQTIVYSCVGSDASLAEQAAVLSVTYDTIVYVHKFNGDILFSTRGNSSLMSPLGTSIAVYDENYTKVYSLLDTLISTTVEGVPVTFSIDGQRILTRKDNKLALWDTRTGKQLNETESIFDKLSPDGAFYIHHTDQTTLVNDMYTGGLLNSLSGNFHSLSANGQDLTLSANFTDLWMVPGSVQRMEDVSDGVFSVVTPEPLTTDVDLGECITGQSFSLMVDGCVANDSDFPLVLDSIQILGDDAYAFGLVSGIPPLTVFSKSTQPIEFSFAPSRDGLHKATLVYWSANVGYHHVLTANSIPVFFEMNNTFLDFGTLRPGQEKEMKITLVKNIGDRPLIVNAIVNSGPDLLQFNMSGNDQYITVLPGDSLQVNFRYAPLHRGKASAAYYVLIDGIDQIQKIRLYGQAYSPLEVEVNGHITHKKTGNPLVGSISVADTETGRMLNRITADARGYYSVKIDVDRLYELFATKEGYETVRNNIDLTQNLIDTVFTINFQLDVADIGAIFRLSKLFFETASAELKIESTEQLERIAAFMNENPSIVIEIGGHTDDVGTDSDNLQLSEDRANSVMKYLISQGIEPSRMSAVGYGETMPVVANVSEDNRQKNRRVEMKIVRK